MLSRYTMYRRRPPDAGPLPEGIRKDTRWRTSHILRPDQQMVEQFLASPDAAGWQKFREAYLELLADRLAADRAPFAELARQASQEDVYLGCNCPTRKNPDVRHCHTWLALEFMRQEFPSLDVVFPDAGQPGD